VSPPKRGCGGKFVSPIGKVASQSLVEVMKQNEENAVEGKNIKQPFLFRFLGFCCVEMVFVA